MGAAGRGILKVTFLLAAVLFLVLPTPGQGAEPNDVDFAVQANCYVFRPEESTLLQTGGFAGVNWTYIIEGQFCLTVDPNAGLARFTHVDANAVDSSEPTRALDPNLVFNMAGLTGTVIDDTTIEFAGQTSDGSSVLLTLTFDADVAYFTGQTTPPPNSADFFVFTIDAVATRKYASGTGEPNDPYQIATAADLIALGESPEDYDKHFVLTNDIDLDPNLPGGKIFDKAVIAPDIDPRHKYSDEFQGWPFIGVLDGNDHEIRGLTIEISRSSDWSLQRNYFALVGHIGETGQVKHLGLRDVSISAGNADFVGALAGENRGTILSCHSSGNVETWGLVGGLVGGHYSGTITSSYTVGSVKGVRVGGLVGLVWTGTISSCHSTASVVKYEQISDMIGYFEYAGGLVGRNWASTVSHCYASGDVTADVLAGGLVGTNNEGTIHSCYSSSEVTGRGYAGGLVASNSGSIVSCYATGDVSGRRNVGGLAGRAADGSIATSYAVGEVTGSFSAGGLVGGDESRSAWLSYWDVETSGMADSTAGEGKTTQQMISLTTFAGWGHDAQWVLDEGKDYPHLAWEGRPGLPIADPPRIYSGGSGDPNDPYLLSVAEDLIDLGGSPADWNGAFVLANDIDLTSVHPGELLRVGTLALPFGGTFDGRGHTVRGLRTESAKGRGNGPSRVGMFGRVGPSGVIRHLHLTDVDISGDDCVGGLVGCNEGSVLACSVTGSVSASWVGGGAIGENRGTVGSTCTTCTVDAGGRSGGLVGENRGTVFSCYTRGTTQGYCVGGLIGENSGTVTQSYGAVTVVLGRGRTGGLVAYNDPDHGQVTGCFWDTKTWGQTPDDVGIGKTTAEMQMASTFLEAGWDFVGEAENGTEDIWWIDEGRDYPRLWWEVGAETAP